MESEYYGGARGLQAVGMANLYSRQPTMRERIDLAVKQAEERLAAAKEAQAIFERNPDLEKLMDAIQRGGF